MQAAVKLPSQLLLLLLLLTSQLLLLLPRGANSEAAAAGQAAQLLGDTLDAIDKAVTYVGQHNATVNLDGVIGVRTVEDQLGSVLANYWTQLPQWVSVLMRKIQLKASVVSEAAIASVMRNTPAYFRNAGAMLRVHYWQVFYPTRPLLWPSDNLRAMPAGAGRDFSERFSDDCIHEFYGEQKCSISTKCWKKMIESEDLTGYSLTHQLFYLLNGIQANCIENMTAMANSRSDASHHLPLSRISDRLCSRIFTEALQLESRGLLASDRDLFMEQIGLCGLAGYTEFAQWRWLSELLRWQRPNGCYGIFNGERLNAKNFAAKQYGNYRRKRAEAKLDSNGCLSHRTSVALDALVAYVRRLVEVGMV